MNSFLAVFKRELKSYFTTPLAYVFLVIFLFFSGYQTFRQGFFEMRQADMRTFFMNLPLLFIFMVPSTAMRLWAEERKGGTIELLFVPYDCFGTDFSYGDYCLLPWQSGHRFDYYRILGQLLNGRRFSCYWLFLLGVEQKPGHQLCPLGGCLRDSCFCRHADDAELFLNFFTCRFGFSD